MMIVSMATGIIKTAIVVVVLIPTMSFTRGRDVFAIEGSGPLLWCWGAE